MKHLARIVRGARPSAGLLLRAEAYGKRGLRDFLRDVSALANADVDGPRYIVTGVEGSGRQRRLHSVPRADFSGKPDYAAAVRDYLEPLIDVTYDHVDIDGKSVGVFTIAAGHDQPYMLRIDHSETLRRGDASHLLDASVHRLPPPPEERRMGCCGTLGVYVAAGDAR